MIAFALTQKNKNLLDDGQPWRISLPYRLEAYLDQTYFGFAQLQSQQLQANIEEGQLGGKTLAQGSQEWIIHHRRQRRLKSASCRTR